WLVGTKALKGHFPFSKAVEVAGLANMIGVLEAVVKTLLILVTGNIFASPSLALLVKEFDPQNPVHSLLAQGKCDDILAFGCHRARSWAALHGFLRAGNHVG